MTEYVDSMGIYALISGINCVPSQLSLMQRWNSIGFGNLNICIRPGLGARGNPVLDMPFGATIVKTLTHQAKFCVGMLVNMNSNAGVGGGPLITLGNCDRNICELSVNADGSITVYADPGAGNVLMLTTAIAITAFTNAYLEFVVTLSGTTNIVVTTQVYVNGVLLGNSVVFSGINNNTLKSLNTTMNRIFLSSGVATNGGTRISDFYINNGSGSTNTGPYLNPTLAIDAYPLPNGDNSPLQWIPLGGVGAHYSEINELPADADASYVLSATIGNKDSYDWQDIASFSGTIKTVQLSYCARTDAEGLRSFRGNINSTEQNTPTFGLPGTYQYFHTAFDVDPATGVAWTRTGFNAKPFGIELVS